MKKFSRFPQIRARVNVKGRRKALTRVLRSYEEWLNCENEEVSRKVFDAAV